MSYRIERLSDAGYAEHPFGEVREFLRGIGEFGVARIKMTNDHKHHHEKTTEVYYILSGKGRIELDGDEHPIEPDTAIMIEPGTRHRARADMGDELDLLVFSMPAYDPKDVFPEEEGG